MKNTALTFIVLSNGSIYASLSTSLCVCVCVCERERKFTPIQHLSTGKVFVHLIYLYTTEQLRDESVCVCVCVCVLK